jgi:hypothetical protein
MVRMSVKMIEVKTYRIIMHDVPTQVPPRLLQHAHLHPTGHQSLLGGGQVRHLTAKGHWQDSDAFMVGG